MPLVDSVAARRFLEGELRLLPSSRTEGHLVEVVDAWVEGENIVCVTYRAPGSMAFWVTGGPPGRPVTKVRMT
jgi:hypothetical protein